MPPRRRRSVRNGGPSEVTQGAEGDQGSSALLPEWQILIADMQARMANQEEELRRLRQQVRTANSGNGGALAAVAAGTGSHWEVLYERFRKQHPPAFVGGARETSWLGIAATEGASVVCKVQGVWS